MSLRSKKVDKSLAKSLRAEVHVLEQSPTPRNEKEQLPSTNEMTMILDALTALKRGNASVRLPAEWTGLSGKVAEVFNDVVEQNDRMYRELERLSRVVG